MHTLQRVWTALGWFGVASVVVLSLVPLSSTPSIEHGDKFEHVLAYAVLMWWFAQMVTGTPRRLWLALGLLALGIALEFAQGLTTWRSFSYADMAADALGVASGWLLSPPRTPSVLALLGRRLAGAAR